MRVESLALCLPAWDGFAGVRSCGVGRDADGGVRWGRIGFLEVAGEGGVGVESAVLMGLVGRGSCVERMG